MSKEYRGGVAYEEGFVVDVKADSKEQASKKVYDRVDMYGDCFDSLYINKLTWEVKDNE